MTTSPTRIEVLAEAMRRMNISARELRAKMLPTAIKYGIYGLIVSWTYTNFGAEKTIIALLFIIAARGGGMHG